MKVLSVASEIYPFVKTGGLADVTGGLALALRKCDVTMVSLVPGYPAVLSKLPATADVFPLGEVFGGPARLISARVNELSLLVVDAPHLYNRPGNPYTTKEGADWDDNAFRFGALSKIAARIGRGEYPGFIPDIVHCHDWHSGLAPAYLALEGGRKVGTIVTIHNLAYQGNFPAELLAPLALPPKSFSIDGVEFHGAIGFLKAGLNFADRITTVSPSYADEIKTPEYGCGLDGLLRHRSGVLSGIINGIDTDTWDPEEDTRIASRFSRKTLASRAGNRTALRRRFGLGSNADGLVIGVVSRLVWQKGLDLLADAAPSLLSDGGEIVILGSGERGLETQLAELAAQNPGRIGFISGYDEDIAHLMQAGSDVLLVPSRFEPCGITQLCAMRYGAVPVVSKLGGLRDTVSETGNGKAETGFHIWPVTSRAIEMTFQRVRTAWSNKTRWRRLQKNGMGTDVSWTKSAQQYAKLYSDVVATRN